MVILFGFVPPTVYVLFALLLSITERPNHDPEVSEEHGYLGTISAVFWFIGLINTFMPFFGLQSIQKLGFVPNSFYIVRNLFVYTVTGASISAGLSYAYMKTRVKGEELGGWEDEMLLIIILIIILHLLLVGASIYIAYTALTP